MECSELQRAIEAILFVAGEPVDVERLAKAAGVSLAQAEAASQALMDDYAFSRRGIRVVRLENRYQMCSSPEQVQYVTTALETRKPPKLSASQLEALTVIAYYQPTTKAYVEQLRGVDSSYCISALLNKKLIEECGRLNVPGRPFLYRTTPDFLRTFGLQSLQELPEIERGQMEPIEQEPEQQEMQL